MPAKYRLTRADFKNMRGFRRLQGRFFSLSFGTIHSRATGGAACIVSSKVAAKAVTRNRIKRRCREAMRELVSNRALNTVFVVVAKKGASTATAAETAADLHNLFARAGGTE